MRVIIGIDPGLKGGVARLVETDGKWSVDGLIPMPLDDDRHPDVVKLLVLIGGKSIIYDDGTDPDFHITVVVEKSQPAPGQGVSSIFHYGAGYGHLLATVKIISAILACGSSIKLHTPRPQDWKAKTLRGFTHDKEGAFQFCSKAYPKEYHEILTNGGKKKPHDGMADALCIANYASNYLVISEDF